MQRNACRRCSGGGSLYFFFFSSRRRHTRLQGDWSSDVCSSDLEMGTLALHDNQANLEGCQVAMERLLIARNYFLNALRRGGDRRVVDFLRCMKLDRKSVV